MDELSIELCLRTSHVYTHARMKVLSAAVVDILHLLLLVHCWTWQEHLPVLHGVSIVV